MIGSPRAYSVINRVQNDSPDYSLNYTLLGHYLHRGMIT